MIALLTVAVLAADPVAPSAVVLLGRRTTVTAAEATALTRSVATSLEANGLTLSLPPDAATAALKRLSFPDTATCGGKRECLVELGRQLEVQWVFAVSVTRVEKDRSVGVELIRVDDGTSPERDAVILSPKAELTVDLLAGFSSRVKARWAPPVPDTPTVVVTTPKEPPPVDLPPPPPPPAPEAPRSHVASYVLGAAAGGALIASGIFLGLGVSRWSTVYPGMPMSPPVSPLTFGAAVEARDAANMSFILSGVLGGLALALGTVAILVW
jgi:hypothetical protein